MKKEAKADDALKKCFIHIYYFETEFKKKIYEQYMHFKNEVDSSNE